MLSLSRTKAIMYRYTLLNLKDIYRWVDIIFWNLLDIFLFGFTALGFGQLGTGKSDVTTMLVGVVMWQVMYRSNTEFAINLLQEIWDQNLVNFFTTPVRLCEWVLAIMAVSIVRTAIATLISFVCIYFVFGVNLFKTIIPFGPHYTILLLSGWAIGLCSCSLLISYGKQVQHLVWPLPFLFLIFTGAFYPLHVLPDCGVAIALILPMSYIFEHMRTYSQSGFTNYKLLIHGSALSILYFLVALKLFYWRLKASRVNGLARLE